MINFAEYEKRRKQKKYCKDCKFRPPFDSKYCEPSIPVGVEFDDYHGPRHFVKRKKIGTFERSEQNAQNDCNCYVRKWWKFGRPK